MSSLDKGLHNQTSITLALLGVPNCGKSTLFNTLTGLQQKIANYAGVTVEKKQGNFKIHQQVIHLVDLPGTYDLFNPFSMDEEVTLTQAKQSDIDGFICVVDASKLSNQLNFINQVLQLKKPIVLVLNMMDIAKQKGIEIDINKLSHLLGIEVIGYIATEINNKELLTEHLNKFCKIITKKYKENATNTQTNQQLLHKEIKQTEKIGLNIDEIIKQSIHSKQAHALNKWLHNLDRVTLHPIYGLLILVVVLFLIFQAVFSWSAPFADAIEWILTLLSDFLANYMPNGLLKKLLLEGVLAGIGAVLVFIPQIAFLLFFLLVLEQTGYLPRAACLLDGLMSKIGLSGRSFIPLLSGFACAIPATLATRTLSHPLEKLITLSIIPLMTCSARLPVYSLLIGAFIPAQNFLGIFNLQGFILFVLYLLAIVSAIVVALIIKLLFKKKYQHTPQLLMLELPNYHMPNWQNITIEVLKRCQLFLSTAGTTILALMIILWFLSNFPSGPANTSIPAIHYSFAGQIAGYLHSIFAPIGFNWQICLALIPGLAAREVAVAALGTVYAIETGEDFTNLSNHIANHWSLATGLSLLVWYVYAPQCVASLGVMYKEMHSKKQFFAILIYLIGLAYGASYLIYQIFS